MKSIFFAFVAFTAVISVHGDADVYYPEDESAMTSDARSWYEQEISNSNKDFTPAFTDILNSLKAGQVVNSALKTQLNAFLEQVNDANENTKPLIPKLEKLVQKLTFWSSKPGFLNRMRIKATLYFVNGRRDNKSYYLLNGAGRWAKIRSEAAASSGASKLASDLNGFKNDAFLARDTLDDAAQILVKALAKLVQLQPDLPATRKEFYTVAREMQDELKTRVPAILEAAQKAVDNVKAYIATL